jgi:SAM-dependent methyltransferase
MSLLGYISSMLKDRRLISVDYNSDELLKIHSTILNEKKMIREVFHEFYNICIALDKKYFIGDGQRIELGAGVGFVKSIYPEIITTDVKKSENIDFHLDAMNMCLADNSVRAFYGINCFHHFPLPEKFFNEIIRTLQEGGGCILIEPYYGFLARIFYKRLFNTETFDISQQGWSNEKNNIMKDANQALSYIIFKRDRKKFENLFPELEIVYQKPLNNYIRYLISGGLNFKQLLPDCFTPILKIKEYLLSPLAVFLALHHVIVLRKRERG